MLDPNYNNFNFIFQKDKFYCQTKSGKPEEPLCSGDLRSPSIPHAVAISMQPFDPSCSGDLHAAALLWHADEVLWPLYPSGGQWSFRLWPFSSCWCPDQWLEIGQASCTGLQSHLPYPNCCVWGRHNSWEMTQSVRSLTGFVRLSYTTQVLSTNASTLHIILDFWCAHCLDWVNIIWWL